MEEGAEGGEEGQAGSQHRDLIERRGASWEAASPYLVVVLVALWLCRPFWFPGRYVVGFDTYAYSGPNLEVTERAARDLRLPVLNELIFGGVPHLGNPSAAALYPPQLLTLLFETNRAMGILVTLHVVLLGTGTVLLLRRLGIGRVGAAVAGVAAVASGAAVTKTVQFEQILVIAWAPLLLASIHAVLNAPRPWRPVAGTAAVTAAVLLAGHPQLVYQTVVLAIAATIGFAVGGERWRRLPHVVLGALVGAMIALPQLVAVLYATADSLLEDGRTIDELLQPALSLQPSASARAVLGTVQDVDPAVFAGGFESIVFLGVAMALLALVGFTDAVGDRDRRPWAISIAAVGAVALIWSIGPRTFVFDVAFEVMPGFDLARASARWLVVVAIIAAMFAGVGVDAVERRVGAAHLLAVAAGVGIVAVLLALDVVGAEARTIVIWAVTALVLVAAIAAASLARGRASVAVMVTVVVVGAIELFVMSLHSIPQSLATDRPFTSYSTPAVEFLAGQGSSTLALTDDGLGAAYEIPAFRPNANVLAVVPSIDGYDGGVQITERWANSLQRFTEDPATELPLRNSLQLPITTASMARLGVRYVLLDRDRPAEVFLPGWSGPVAASGELDVWENPDWIGAAVAWQRATVADPAVAPGMLRTDPAGVEGVALVDALGTTLSCTATTGCDPVGVELDEVSPEHLVVRTALDRASVVSVTRQALPGWEVDVDGRPAEVHTVDGLFLGVEVPAGEHTITWRYRSPWLLPTLLLALAGVAAATTMALFDTVQRRVVSLK